MGEVYRARDTKLGRDVAIKILPAVFTKDPDRLARFEREARVLATLNHPNIGAIYGLEEGILGRPAASDVLQSGQTDQYVRALVLELVEGETLAERLLRGPAQFPAPGFKTSKPPAENPTPRTLMSLADALAVARQITDALDTAHEKGIVHRDLKPANIMITPDGVVKVLDFGLAKLAQGSSSGVSDFEEGSEVPTMTIAGTREGMILGTAAYMSPEQARGQVVDKRTDIWAFGCLLFEMLSGRAPFTGATLTDTLAAIVERAPDWDALPPATPPALQRLLRRCLDKDQKQRLRDIGDARVEIEDARTAAATSTSAARVQDLRTTRLPWIAAGCASVVAIAAVTTSMWPTQATSSVDDSGPQVSRIVPVTSGPARDLGPEISPDGKWVAYLSSLGGRPDVWVRFIAGGEAANLTASAGIDVSATTGITGLEISPDGTRIAVMAKARGVAGPFATWEIPAPLPGVPRKLLDDGLLGMRWSLDARQITFIRAGAAAGDALWVADAEGTNRREIVAARDGIHIHWPTWSRDGFVYFIRTITTVANLDQAEIYRVDSRGGAPEPVVSTLRRAMHPLIMPNGGGLIYAASPTGVDLGLWWQPMGGGEPRRLTMGIGDYAEPRMSSDGRTLVATRFELRQSLTRVALTPAAFGRVTAVTDGFGGDLDPSMSPSGDRLVFSSSRTGDRHLWTSRIDGSDMRPLTSGNALDDRPTFSPDGRQIAFNSDRDGRRGIWVIGADGGTPRKLAEVSTTGGLSWSADGRMLVYAAGTGGWPGLGSVSIQDGQVQRIATPGAASEPVWNPNRDLIAYLEPATTGAAYTKLGFVNSMGRPQYPTLPPAPEISAGFSNGMLSWSPDGRQLAVVSQNTNAAASIWLVDPESATPFRKLVELPIGPRIRGVTWTRDSSALIIGHHDTTSDIVILDGR